MWYGNWRESVWDRLGREWDLIVVGGGITGAGILREAAGRGLKTLLVEQRDFSWGTSSRSSKLVHGGLRYLKEGKLHLTYASIRERERLLANRPGLVEPMGFLLTVYRGDSPGRWALQAGLAIYDLLAGKWAHRRYRGDQLDLLAPHIASSGLACGLQYTDAQTDDSRLVLRVIREGVASGGTALNYARAESLVRDADGQVIGIRLVDTGGATNPRPAVDVRARVVVNATGAWADGLRGRLGKKARIRPLRGSHLVFPRWRLPLAQAISFLHPLDGRPVFAFPWEGATLLGTTDMDHQDDLDREPRISRVEVDYLLTAVREQFPAAELTREDIISTFAGVRAVIDSGKEDPSKESRDHVVWDESGMLTVTGGKLTTFRLIARDVIRALRSRYPDLDTPKKTPVWGNTEGDSVGRSERIDRTTNRRLRGRYGGEATGLVAAARPGELETIPGTYSIWAEVRWAARTEGVVHLDDLLLRRLRIGLLSPEGGRKWLPRIRTICAEELGWNDDRWEAEKARYLSLWQEHYGVPRAAAEAGG